MKKILITGANGMLGSMLSKLLDNTNKFEVIALGHTELDITSEGNIKQTIEKYNPDIIVNCAAYTNVEKAEEEIEASNLINGFAPGYLAKESKEKNIQFIHISTDFVFYDDKQDGHIEDDDPEINQVNQYGRSKRLGEIEVLKNNPNAYILRISSVFGPNGKNFVDIMLTLAETRSELTVVDDEVGVPCYTKDISNHIIYVIENADKLKPGFYHAVNEGQCSRYEQAVEIFKIAGKNINVIPSQNYPRKAKISKFLILKNTKLPKAQDWKRATREYIESK